MDRIGVRSIFCQMIIILALYFLVHVPKIVKHILMLLNTKLTLHNFKSLLFCISLYSHIHPVPSKIKYKSKFFFCFALFLIKTEKHYCQIRQQMSKKASQNTYLCVQVMKRNIIVAFMVLWITLWLRWHILIAIAFWSCTKTSLKFLSCVQFFLECVRAWSSARKNAKCRTTAPIFLSSLYFATLFAL